MRIPFTKAHGAKNDFLLTWANEAPWERLPEVARAICDRHTGVGADGWLIVAPVRSGAHDAAIRLFNPDGSEPEISGNGTRCAAAFLLDAGLAKEEIVLSTGAGPKHLRLVKRQGLSYLFDMNMGRPLIEDKRYALPTPAGPLDVTILNVGNPQCAVFVADLLLDWRRLGSEVERHPHFPNRTNVSFVLPLDEHTIEVRFFERGAGETLSSGTGSTGAAVAAIVRGAARSPVRVLTPAGPLEVRWETDDVVMTGPVEIVAGGEYYF